MSADIIDGRAAALRLRERVAEVATSFHALSGRRAGLVVVLVGEDPASNVYVRSKGKATIAAGMASFEHRLPAETTQTELLALVVALNDAVAVDGILVQLPLPSHIDERAVIAAINPAKDVDGFHPVNAGRLATGLDGFVPCTPLGCLMLLEERLGSLAGKEAVVIGRSNIVGKPMAALLTRASATVTLAHSRTHDLAGHVGRADIVVAAVGRPGFVRGEWLKPGATVIDVGINRTDDGLTGDVDFAGAASVAAAITPVPGGVGPMTIACLLRNTVVAAHRNEGLALDEDAI
jgi:methylenetetrahydrofolate dehydrogenase (NADP+)/methenyltetrahydrofolate cyclohydrolase